MLLTEEFLTTWLDQKTWHSLGCFVAMLLALAGVRRMWRTKAVC